MLDEAINLVLKNFLGANFELNDLIVNFVPFFTDFWYFLAFKKRSSKILILIPLQKCSVSVR